MRVSWSQLARPFAASAVILAIGGLILVRSPASASLGARPLRPLGGGTSSATFVGAGAHGVFALSHSKVLSGAPTSVSGELRLVADKPFFATARAPLSLAVVLDTSGSMSDGKLDDAKSAVLRLLSDMHDEDEIALVRYSDASELIQPLARVGTVRATLPGRIRALRADGGTNIPGGLSHGLRALDDAAKGRVRRIVLVSDGLDDTRAQAETLARNSFANGITVSSLGIGLDFDESYMGAVAQDGHGNFAFIAQTDVATNLAQFLKRELEETATTTIENVVVHVDLPRHMRFVSASGADVRRSASGVDLTLGSLFGGDERRVILELESDGAESDASTVQATATWSTVGRSGTAFLSVDIPALRLVATSDPAEVERGRDGAVMASATSVLASKRQLEASNAWARGDVARAEALAAENEAALGRAASAAPAPAATALEAQARAYSVQRKNFAAVAPTSVEASTVRKAEAAADLDNLSRPSRF
jgi:Ca-activated chloride channel family protein